MSTGGVVGGVAMPHAPQFLTLPDTEPVEVVDEVKALAKDIGNRLAALDPDAWVIVANDHANQFFLHCAAPFVIHRGKEVDGSFAGRDFHYAVAATAATNLVRDLQDDHFDPAFTSTASIDYAFGIPLTFLGVEGPIIPVYVNSYVPPQPTVDRCYALGRAMARSFERQGLRVVVIASGGLSHFPGTSKYSDPDVEFDEGLFASIRAGNLKAVLSMDSQRLDETGNVELRSWAIAAGMLGERKPDVASLNPSWHHVYATAGWFSPVSDSLPQLHYPPIDPERVAITKALYVLANDASERVRYLENPTEYAASLTLSEQERAALVELTEEGFEPLRVHPLVVFLARMQIQRQGQPHDH